MKNLIKDLILRIRLRKLNKMMQKAEAICTKHNIPFEAPSELSREYIRCGVAAKRLAMPVKEFKCRCNAMGMTFTYRQQHSCITRSQFIDIALVVAQEREREQL